MSVEIRVRPRARSDLEEATQWYESQRTGLGSDFLDEVERAFGKLQRILLRILCKKGTDLFSGFSPCSCAAGLPRPLYSI